MFFLGAVTPAVFLSSGFPPFPATFFLTYGYYNLLVVIRNDSHAQELERFLKEKKQPHEVWEIEKNVLCQHRAFVVPPDHASTRIHTDWRETLQAICALDFPASTRELLHDYAPLMASAIARCELFLPPLGSELRLFNAQLLDDAKESMEEMQKGEFQARNIFESHLKDVTAAVARLSSQCFSGVSPIVLTECHFWIHSLLGIGTATLALQRISSFVEDALGRFNFALRVFEFSRRPPVELHKTPFADKKVWHDAYLGCHSEEIQQEYENDRYPMLVYFSRRDGFRQASRCTLSAPLSSVNACDALPWSLFNITHELSHVFVETVLGEIIDSSEDGIFQKLYDWSYNYDEGNRPKSFLDSIRYFFISIVAQHHAAQSSKKLTITDAEHLRDIYGRLLPEFREVAVHLFDFIYFYKKDEKTYVKGIWLSWNVLPDLRRRYDDYIVRTLAALSVNQLHLETNRADATIARFLEITKELQATLARIPSNAVNIFEEIHDHLEKRREKLKPLLLAFINLAQFMSTILYSEEAAAQLHIQNHKNFSGAGGILIPDHLDNPLKYLLEKTRNLDPSGTQSLCMLNSLAYNRPEIAR